MLKRIRQYFFDRAVKRVARVSRYRSWEGIRTILVLFESDLQEKNAEARAFVKMLQNEGNRVVVCCYVDKKVAETATLENYVVLDRQKCNWLGKPIDTVVSKMLDEKFDVVMDVTECDVKPLQYMLLWAKCDFRCGKSRGEGGNGLYDFVIEMPERPIDPKTNALRMDYDFIGEIGSQIVKYLKLIKNE
jgi:hypothetical protein